LLKNEFARLFKTANIEVFLTDISETHEKGKSLCRRWFGRLAD